MYIVIKRMVNQSEKKANKESYAAGRPLQLYEDDR